MDIEFCIQDPTRADTKYLYEAIIEAAKGAATWRGIFAFASRDGVKWLFEDPVIDELMHGGGEIDLVVGLDAITNRQTLERLQQLEQMHGRFRPRVFWNDVVSLFHPKISDFTYAGGGRTLIVGSGNLTPGGLMNNIEAYTVVSTRRGESIDVSALDEFLARHADAIRTIDCHALERAEKNAIRRNLDGRRTGPVVFTSPPRPKRPIRLVPDPGTGRGAIVDRVLIAQIPRAGGRWSQVHFNSDVVREYFRMTDLESHRAYLSHIQHDGSRSEVEVRPCLFGQSNRNHRIEFGACRGKEYPAKPPILVTLERQIRVFDYMLLLPGDEGYPETSNLFRSLPSVGRGLPRVVIDTAALDTTWPGCPLLSLDGSDGQMI